MSTLSEREKLFFLIFNEPLSKADVIVLLEGDGYSRLPHTARLYQDSWAPKIVVSGGAENAAYGSFPAHKLVIKLTEMGIASDDIIIEATSQSTKEQAINIVALAKEKGWKKIILVASHYHQPRAFLTFLKALRDAKAKLHIINAPARELPWFEPNPWGRRFDLLDAEIDRMERYKDDLASFREGIIHQQKKKIGLPQRKSLKRKRRRS